MISFFYRGALAFEFMMYNLTNMLCFVLCIDWPLLEGWGKSLSGEFEEYFSEDE